MFWIFLPFLLQKTIKNKVACVGENIMGGDVLKKMIGLITTFLIFSLTVQTAFAQGTTYMVVKDDSLWKISVKYMV
jgi:nucleoid-associated protein YgaU